MPRSVQHAVWVVQTPTGPYFPPEFTGPPPSPVTPAQPGILLLVVVLAVVLSLVVREMSSREIGRHRERARECDVDDLTVTWLPAEAATLARRLGEDVEVLEFGPDRRRRGPGRQRIPTRRPM